MGLGGGEEHCCRWTGGESIVEEDEETGEGGRKEGLERELEEGSPREGRERL